MGDTAALVREIHRLVQGPARTTLEQACREWLEGRRQAIAEAPPWPEWRGENTPKNRKRYGELCKPREKHLPELPWPLDGREVSTAGYCADLAIYHDANCPRCERCPLFPMPLASGDLSDEEVEQATYDGAAWVLLRDAIAENPDADAMQDALEAVLAELRCRGVLSEPPPTSPAVEPLDTEGGGEQPPRSLAPLPVPEKQLTSWREILVALGMTYNSEDKQKVDRLNETFNGPIVKPGQGMQPFANKRKLLEWWNGLEATVQEQANRARDTEETVKGTHAYGREGEVVPEISGEVKKRRKDRQP